MLAWQGCGQPEDLEELENTAEAWGDSCSALSGVGHGWFFVSLRVQSQLSVSSLPLCQTPGFAYSGLEARN